MCVFTPAELREILFAVIHEGYRVRDTKVLMQQYSGTSLPACATPHYEQVIIDKLAVLSDIESKVSAEIKLLEGK